MGLYETVQSIFTSDKSYQQPDMSQYEQPDYNYEEYDQDYDEEVDEDEDEDADPFETAEDSTLPGTSTTTTTPTTRTSTQTPASTAIVVTLNCNGGSCSTASIRVTYNSTYGYLPTPTYKNHEFKGWYTKKSGGSKITSSTKVKKKSNHTIYAHWLNEADKQYKITLDMNGGDENNKSFKIKTGATVPKSKLPNAKRKNYAFIGWFTTPSGGKQVKAGSKFTGKADMTLYAHWEAAQEYWDAFLTNANGDVRDSDRVNYYIEYETGSGTVKTTSDYILHNFEGDNLFMKSDCYIDERKPDDPVEYDGETYENVYELIRAKDLIGKADNETIIIKCISDESEAEEAEEKMMEEFPGCQVIILSNNAAKGNTKEKIFYSLWLGNNLYSNFGAGELDIKKAASELGVKL
jgi:uncharacterized repeat protein (TIGR02543 family)